MINCGNVVEVFIGGRKIGEAATTDELLGVLEGDEKQNAWAAKPITIRISVSPDDEEILTLLRLNPIEHKLLEYQLPLMGYSQAAHGPRNRWGGLK